MTKKLTEADRKEIMASRTGVLPMSAIDRMLLSMWENYVEKGNSQNETTAGKKSNEKTGLELQR